MDRKEALSYLEENPIVNLELIDFILGDFLGFGISRLVFDYKPDNKYVIKLDVSNFNANVMEYHIWNDISETKHSKWFAPIKSMSPCGRVLLQEKCEPLENKGVEKYPKQIPDYLSDIKWNNFGWLDNKFVCIDYAGSNLITKGLTNKLQKVNWYGKGR